MEESFKNVNKMENLKIFVILITAVVAGLVDAKEICPKMCTCDIFEGFKRADCR